jgi:hypothetical protein
LTVSAASAAPIGSSAAGSSTFPLLSVKIIPGVIVTKTGFNTKSVSVLLDACSDAREAFERGACCWHLDRIRAWRTGGMAERVSIFPGAMSF